ncbi:hypothetical protein L2E82_50363 [Cichorium intybus]|nr:hypothetical protein L2E82_50363 [Cichorium intybus]
MEWLGIILQIISLHQGKVSFAKKDQLFFCLYLGYAVCGRLYPWWYLSQKLAGLKIGVFEDVRRFILTPLVEDFAVRGQFC